MVAGIVTIIGALFTVGGSYASYKIGERLAILKAPRTFTPDQRQTIVSSLLDKPPATFWIKSYPDTPESDEYGRQLEKILWQDARWLVPGQFQSRPLAPFPIQSGEEPTTGLTIMVDGRYADAVSSGRSLEAALRNAQVEDVKMKVMEVNPSEPKGSPWVFIKVGRKGNQ
jgi:hypothetical protein